MTRLTSILLILSLLAQPAAAQSYGIGFRKYTQADFEGAETALEQAVKKSGPERAKSYKLLGMCQYILGKRTSAQASFEAAVTLDPKTAIDPAEALDPSVIPFFNGVRTKVKEKLARAPKPAPAKPKAVAAAVPPPTSNRPPPNTPKAVQKTTYLKILSNVPQATVTIDGILAGTTGTLINADPGKFQVEVTAKGYIKRVVSTTVTAGKENVITVDLKKIPPPKPKATPTPEPKAIARNTKRPGNNNARKTYAPDPDAGMFADPGGGADPYAQPAGPDLASEFNRETATGGYGAPPGYAAPPPGYAAPPPAYAPPPVYAAPPPQYYAQPYAQPAPVPPPALPPPSYEAPADPAVEDGPDVDVSDSGGGGGGGGGSGATLFNLLPFGAGQFYRGDTLLGFAFLLTEAGAIGYYFYMSNDAAARAQSASNNIKNGTFESDEKKRQYQQESQANVDEVYALAQYGIYAFAGLYAAGVIEAFIWDPPPAKKKRKARRYGSNFDPFEEMDMALQIAPYQTSNSTQRTLWGEGEDHIYTPSLSLNLKLEF